MTEKNDSIAIRTRSQEKRASENRRSSRLMNKNSDQNASQNESLATSGDTNISLELPH